MIPAILYGSIVGLTLGLTGGGGSIFAVPLLVYGLGLDFRSAVALSLAIVGLTSAYGAILQTRAGNVVWAAGAVLGVGGILAAPLGAWIGARLPQQLSLILFASLMILIGVRMLWHANSQVRGVPLSWIRCQAEGTEQHRFNYVCATKLFVAGLVSGILSGIFGVGGGFLIVPTLILVPCFAIEKALATSLVSITLISASGFLANISYLSPSDGSVALLFFAGSLVGMTLGVRLKSRIPGKMLNKTFALCVIGVAIFMIFKILWNGANL
ncbi:MAG: sulfite exporter TauE/SafE family protein [Chthoniobacterales bacterium]